MGEPVYKLQLVYPDGVALTFEAGSRFERNFIEACSDAIVAQGVGVFRTEAQVKKAIESGIASALLGLKRETISLV